jgi:hypothetical protein
LKLTYTSIFYQIVLGIPKLSENVYFLAKRVCYGIENIIPKTEQKYSLPGSAIPKTGQLCSVLGMRLPFS